MVRLNIKYKIHTRYYTFHTLFSAQYVAEELVHRYPQIKAIILTDVETGEILDIDGICGGYNLASAFITGYIAGSSLND